MKRLALFILLFELPLLQSCEDFLDQVPQSQFSPEKLYTTRNGVEAGLVGLYDNLNGWPSLFQWNTWQLHESLTEYSVPDPGSVDPTRIGKNDLDNTIWAQRSGWSWNYKIIAGANTVLASLENIEVEGEHGLAAEARFMRAYAYFSLVRWFGEIPLVLDPFNPSEESPGVMAEGEIYEQIAQDLDFAIQNLPEASPNTGRANRWIAKAIAAKFYLTRAGQPMNGGDADYTSARDLAVDVIGNGPFTLLDDYSQVFRVNNNAEAIWSVQNRPTGNENHFGFISLPRSDAGLSISGEAVGIPTEQFIASFPEGDFRRQWGIRDQINVNGTLETSSRPFYAKYLDEANLAASANVFGGSLHVPIIRLADLYLIAAEAENEVNGPTNEAYTWINTVRARARMDPSDLTHVPDLAGLSQEEFREKVFRERRWELFFEGDGWFDLKRLGRFNLIETERTELPLDNQNIGNFLIPDFETDNNPNISPGS